MNDDTLIAMLLGLFAVCLLLGAPAIVRGFRLMRQGGIPSDTLTIDTQPVGHRCGGTPTGEPIGSPPIGRHGPSVLRFLPLSKRPDPEDSALGHIADTTRQGPPAVVVALRPDRQR